MPFSSIMGGVFCCIKQSSCVPKGSFASLRRNRYGSKLFSLRGKRISAPGLRSRRTVSTSPFRLSSYQPSFASSAFFSQSAAQEKTSIRSASAQTRNFSCIFPFVCLLIRLHYIRFSARHLKKMPHSKNFHNQYYRILSFKFRISIGLSQADVIG